MPQPEPKVDTAVPVCPKCGASGSRYENASFFGCGSIIDSMGDFRQKDECRIEELASDVLRLTAENEGLHSSVCELEEMVSSAESRANGNAGMIYWLRELLLSHSLKYEKDITSPTGYRTQAWTEERITARLADLKSRQAAGAGEKTETTD